MRKVLVFLFFFIIGLGLFFLVIKWVGWKEIKEVLFAFSGWKGAIILGITLLTWLAGVWKYKFIFKSQGYNLPTLALGEILFATFAITYLFPTTYFGGETFKIYAVRKKFSLPWKKNIAATAIEKLLSMSIILLFLIIGAVSFLFLSNLPFKSFGTITLVFIGGLVICLTIFYFKTFRKESILEMFFKFLRIKRGKNHLAEDVEKEIFRFFDFRKSLMWKGFAIVSLKYFLILTRCWLLIFFLRGELNILVPLAVLFFIFLVFLFPFPAQLGSSEAAQALAFGSLGLGTATGITFSFILRGAEILLAFFGLLLFIKLGIRFFLESEEKI